MRVLFSSKTEKPFAIDAVNLLLQGGATCLTYHGGGDAHRYKWVDTTSKVDYLISYISPYVFPKEQLDRAERAAINFHPGPPEYPGIGCTNFALYNGEKEFGITVHHMKPKVDSGKIIMIKRFPITEGETVWSLSQKCYAYIFTAFCEILPRLLEGNDFKGMFTDWLDDWLSDEWEREPYTRKELDELCVITEDMDEEEIARRIRATTYPDMPGAHIKLGGYKFNAETN